MAVHEVQACWQRWPPAAACLVSPWVQQLQAWGVPADFNHAQMVASAMEVVEAAMNWPRGLEDTISGRGHLGETGVEFVLKLRVLLVRNAQRVLVKHTKAC